MSHIITGTTRVRVERENEREHRVYVQLDGLPDWLLGMIAQAGPLVVDGQAFSAGGGQGPYSVSLRSTLVFTATEASPRVIPKPAPAETIDLPRPDGERWTGDLASTEQDK